MKENLELGKVRDFGELINDTFVFTKQNWKPLLKSVAVICGFFIVGSAVATVLQQTRMLSGVAEGNAPIIDSQFGLEFIFQILFGIATYTLVALTTFCYIAVYRDKNNQPPDVEEVWAYVKYYFWRFLGIQIVVGLLCCVGFVLCVLPGIYLLPIVYIMLAMVVFENAGLSYVFDKSFKLIKNEWWTVFGAVVVMAIVMYALIMALILPVTIAGGIGVFISKGEAPLPFVIATTALSNLAHFVSVLSYIVISLAYFSLLEKKEGLSLLQKIEKIGSKDMSADLPEEEY